MAATRSGNRCEAVCIKVLGGAARQRQVDGTDRAGGGARPPVLMYEAQLPHEVELVIVDVALRNLAVFHLVHDAPPNLDSVPGGGKEPSPPLSHLLFSKPMPNRPFFVPQNTSSTHTQTPLPKTTPALHQPIRKAFAPR